MTVFEDYPCPDCPYGDDHLVRVLLSKGRRHVLAIRPSCPRRLATAERLGAKESRCLRMLSTIRTALATGGLLESLDEALNYAEMVRIARRSARQEPLPVRPRVIAIPDALRELGKHRLRLRAARESIHPPLTGADRGR